MATTAGEYVTFRAIAKDCELHPEETVKRSLDYLKKLLALVWSGRLTINGESIVYLDYDTTRPDYYQVDRVFLRQIIGTWQREKELFRSLPEGKKMTDRDWGRLAAVPIENIPASIRESYVESLSFRVNDLHKWLMRNSSIEWLARWWRRRARLYGYDSSLPADVEVRCVKFIRQLAKESPERPTKRDVEAKARSILGDRLTHSAFDRAWKEAVPEAWKRPGRPTSTFSHPN